MVLAGGMDRQAGEGGPVAVEKPQHGPGAVPLCHVGPHGRLAVFCAGIGCFQPNNTMLKIKKGTQKILPGHCVKYYPNIFLSP